MNSTICQANLLLGFDPAVPPPLLPRYKRGQASRRSQEQAAHRTQRGHHHQHLFPKHLALFPNTCKKTTLKSFHPEGSRCAKTCLSPQTVNLSHPRSLPTTKHRAAGMKRAVHYPLSLFPKINQEYIFLPCFSPTLIFLTIQ